MKRFSRVMTTAVFICVALFGVAHAQSNTYLTGYGFSTNLNMDASIAVSVAVDNTIRGQTVSQNNFTGNVIELVAPVGLIDYWCVNASVNGAPGYNWIWFVKDLLAGDQLSFASGFGLTCANVGAPVQPFEPVDTGDFTGEIVADTCAGDLSQCESDLATANSALATCNSNLGQCQADLAQFQSGCNLPPLTYPYEAQLTGGGILTGGKLKFAVKKPLAEAVSGTVKYPSGVTTMAIDLVPPHSCVDYWCVKDATGLWFVRDNGTGCDLVSRRVGAGLSCVTDGPNSPFEPITSSDIKGKIRGIDKTCPAL